MRHGYYATVEGREYRAEKQQDGGYLLFSDQEESGFAPEGSRWVKKVEKEAVSRLVFVKTIATLGASRMEAYPVDEENCRVVTSNKELAEVLGMEKLGRAEFQKVVPIAKLKAVTEKIEEREA